MDIRDKLDIDLFDELKDIPNSYLSYIDDSRSHQAERLEYLGDSVLSIIVTDMLFDRFENMGPGIMTELRTSIIKNMTLSYLLIKKGLCTVRNKKCADKLEILIGVIYSYTNKNIAFVEKYLNQVFNLSLVLEELIYSDDSIENILDDIVPIYSRWTGKCDKGTKTYTRACLTGKCKWITKKEPCITEWSECNNGYMTRYLEDGQKEVKLCNIQYGKCDKNGMRTVQSAFGTYNNEICPEDLYDKIHTVDRTCNDGNIIEYKKCKDPNLCEDIVWDSYPCDSSVPSVDEFNKLDHEEQWIVYYDIVKKYNITISKIDWDIEAAYKNLLELIYPLNNKV